ncbi:MAG: OsmC family protein [Bacillus sp. (in: firmicutes)]
MATHHFLLKTHWPGLRNDTGTMETGKWKTVISIPEEMDGPGAGTNPDEMLLGAAATCYIITLAALMERSRIEKVDLQMESEGIVEVENGVFTYKKIIHRPFITLPSDAPDKKADLVRKLAKKAETSCMISRAIQGNIDLSLEVTIM